MGTAALFSGSWCVRKPVESKSSVDPMSYIYLYIYIHMLFHYFDFVLLFAIEFERYYIHRPYFRIGIYIYVVYLDLYMLLYIDSHISLYLDLCLCSNFYLHMRHHSAAPCAINHVQKRLDLWGKKPVMYRMSMNSMNSHLDIPRFSTTETQETPRCAFIKKLAFVMTDFPQNESKS